MTTPRFLVRFALALALLLPAPAPAQKLGDLPVATTADTTDRVVFLDVGVGGKTITIGNLSLLFTPAWSAISGKPTTLSGYGITDGQPLDSDLTAIAALTTTGAGRTLLDDADAAAQRINLGLVLGTNVQAFDTDLTTYAGITPSANVQTLLSAANFAAFKTLLSLNAVENTALSTWAGSSNVTTLGTIGTGAWNATAIATSKGGAPSGGSTGQVLKKSSGTSYDYAWAAESGGGGSTLTDPGVAYVRSDGNDTTGTVGNPALPYLTAQAAIDDGATALDLGVGSFGSIALNDTIGNLYLRGRGQTKTAISTVTFNGGTLWDTGSRSFVVANVTGTGNIGLQGIVVGGSVSGNSGGGDPAANIFIAGESVVVGDVTAAADSGDGGAITLVGAVQILGSVDVTSSSGNAGTVTLKTLPFIEGTISP